MKALEENKLVIFASTGVSTGKPSKPPGFEALALKIAPGEPLLKEEGKDWDRFLGRMQKKGIAVHDLAARELSGPRLRSNSLHRHLLRVFGTPEKV
jgi:hypothetical protein